MALSVQQAFFPTGKTAKENVCGNFMSNHRDSKKRASWKCLMPDTTAGRLSVLLITCICTIPWTNAAFWHYLNSSFLNLHGPFKSMNATSGHCGDRNSANSLFVKEKSLQHTTLGKYQRPRTLFLLSTCLSFCKMQAHTGRSEALHCSLHSPSLAVPQGSWNAIQNFPWPQEKRAKAALTWALLDAESPIRVLGIVIMFQLEGSRIVHECLGALCDTRSAIIEIHAGLQNGRKEKNQLD